MCHVTLRLSDWCSVPALTMRLVGVLGIAFLASSAVAADRPNIVFTLSDDQGYGDLGCYGSKDIATPNIDRLCAEGMKFERFYVHNLCTPTRATLMTGCHAQRVGMNKVVYRRDNMGLNDDEVTVAKLLQQAGYATGIVGKWHLGEWDQFNPTRYGFDSFYGFMECDDQRTTAICRDRDIAEKVKSKTDGQHSPKLEKAGLKFITKNQNRPFFLYYSLPLPHTKWTPLDRFAGSSVRGTYGDVVQAIDWQVGELLNSLQNLGLGKNTLVVLASDNGPQLNVEGHGSSGILRDGKWTNFEGGIRFPCVMRWPNHIAAGSVNQQITGIIDMLPTFCELAGVDVPSERVIAGRSLVPYLLSKSMADPIHENFIVPGVTIRHRNWKLLLNEQTPGGSRSDTVGKTDRVAAAAGSLFNLKNDPGERMEVSAKYPEKVQQLEGLISDFMAEFIRRKRPAGKLADDRH